MQSFNLQEVQQALGDQLRLLKRMRLRRMRAPKQS